LNPEDCSYLTNYPGKGLVSAPAIENNPAGINTKLIKRKNTETSVFIAAAYFFSRIKASHCRMWFLAKLNSGQKPVS